MDHTKSPRMFKWEYDQLLVDEKVFSHRCVQPQCTGCVSGTSTHNYRFNYPYLPDGASTGYSTRKDACGNSIHQTDYDWYYWSRGSEKRSNFAGQHYYNTGTHYNRMPEYGLGIKSWYYPTAHSSRLQIDAT